MVRRARQVVWSPRSIEDTKAISKYWNNKNKSTVYSKKLERLFDESIIATASNPYIGKKTGYEDTRFVIVKQFKLVYRVTNYTIEVVRVWDTRQNPKKFKIKKEP